EVGEAYVAGCLFGKSWQVAARREVPRSGWGCTGKGDDAAGTGEQERESVVGDLLDAEIRDVHDEDAEACRVFDRDVVDTDPVARHDEATRGCVERLARDALPVGEDRVRRRGELNQLGLFARLGYQQLGADLGEDLALDRKRRPRVVGDKNDLLAYGEASSGAGAALGS